MKYEWNPDKNEWLKTERNISFEQIIFHLGRGNVWRISGRPNLEKYLGQRLYFVIVNDYIYIVPHIVEQDYIFLKTIIPSRKATRDYYEEMEKNL